MLSGLCGHQAALRCLATCMAVINSAHHYIYISTFTVMFCFDGVHTMRSANRSVHSLTPVACTPSSLQVTVVLKGMFTPDEAAAGGASFATELETDVAAECAKLGKVEKVGSHQAEANCVCMAVCCCNAHKYEKVCSVHML